MFHAPEMCLMATPWFGAEKETVDVSRITQPRVSVMGIIGLFWIFNELIIKFLEKSIINI